VGYVTVDAVKAILTGVNKFSIRNFHINCQIWVQCGITDLQIILLNLGDEFS
jgi:hypothetical protein